MADGSGQRKDEILAVAEKRFAERGYHATSVRDIADSIVQITGAAPSLCEHIEDRPGQVDKHISSTDKAHRLLDWKATTDLNSGLERTIAWYRDNTEWWQKRDWMKHVTLTLPDNTQVQH